MKNITIWPFYGTKIAKISLRAHIWASRTRTFWSITWSFLVQFQIFLYPDTQETKSFRMSPYFHGLGPKIKMTSVAPIYGHARSARPDGRVTPETPPKVAPRGGAY